MAVYAIGDVQGCYEPLLALLEQVNFDRRRDRLWLVGDLVNRGPDSLGVLRFVRGMGDAATVVLGNHDLYLLMVAAGFRKRGKDDTLEAVLAAPDRDDLLEWLASRPLMHVEGDFAMVHAGLVAQWSVAQARALAAEVEAELQGPRRDDFLSRLPGNLPDRWDPGLEGQDRLRFIVNAMTRMRFCTRNGRLDFDFKGPPERSPEGLTPWYQMPKRASTSHTLICGHWSALGFRRLPGVLALDSGCLWGGSLTAVRLDDGEVFQVPSRAAPGRR